MTTIVLRNVKGSPLTFTEMDNNFTNLNNDKLGLGTDPYTVTETSGTVVTFSNTDAYPGRFEVTTTSTGGWATGASHLQVEYDFISTGYFAAILANGAGHIGVGLRLDGTVLGSHIRGHGHLIGLCSNGYQLSTDLTSPNAMLETWMGGLGVSQANIVYPGSELPPGYKFEDGVNYKVIMDSCVDHADRKWLRARYYKKDTSGFLTDTVDGSVGFWMLLWDTGYWLDTNPWADFTKTGIWFYSVFEPVTSWSVDFKNLKVRWGPYLGQAEEATAVRHFRNGDYNSVGLFPRSDAFGPTGESGTFRMSGLDNTSMLNYANTYPNFDWAEWCDTNDLKNKLTALSMSSTNATAVEAVVRPLYCILGTLCKAAKDRGW